VIHHAFTGGIFRAVDETTGAEVIVKQARPNTGGVLSGTDVRDRRRHEAAMLELFAPSGHTRNPSVSSSNRANSSSSRRWCTEPPCGNGSRTTSSQTTVPPGRSPG